MNPLFFVFFLSNFTVVASFRYFTLGKIRSVQSQRMVQQLLSTSTIVVPLSESIRMYFRAYYNFKGMIVTLPWDSGLISKCLSYLRVVNNSYSFLSSAFSALQSIHDIILYASQGNPDDIVLSSNIVESSQLLFSTFRSLRKKRLLLGIWIISFDSHLHSWIAISGICALYFY